MQKKTGRTAGQHSFAQIPRANIERSTFNRSCGLKTTFDAGWLIPIFVDEALPGDTMNMNMSTFARLATPLHPVLDNMWIDYQFWAVPMRLIWDNWEKFNGAQDDPADSVSFLIPTMDAPASVGYANETLSDYMGIPTKIPDLEHSSMWHRAYNLIFNTWYRDQNLQDSLVVDKDDGPDDPTDYVLKRRGKRHDYFTSSLPWPQKGNAVSLSLGTSAVTTMDTSAANVFAADASGAPSFVVDGNTRKFGWLSSGPGVTWDGNSSTTSDPAQWLDPQIDVDIQGKLGTTDLTTATAITINALREAVQLQKMYERDARGGTRYIELIKSHFGVTSPDSRLQRPEFLGGGKSAINIHPVPQTSATEAGTELGNLAAYGTSTGHGIRFVKSFTEHCVILGFASARADLNYQQGLPRMFSRSTRFDFFWPALARLGEQEVLKKEIYAQGPAVGPDTDDETWAYQERWAEYRYKPSTLTGKMRSNDAASLDTWHLAQDFASLPVLGDTFIQDTPPVDRVIAVPAEPHLIFDAYFDFKHVRPMPVYSVPGHMDRF